MTGIGLGLARETRHTWVKCVAPVLGLLAAMALHSLWNLSAIQAATFFAAYFVVMVPAFVAVIVVAIFSLRREAKIIRAYLASVVADGVLSDDDIAILTSVTRRIGASSQALLTRGFAQWRARRRFHALATELAFHSWRNSREVGVGAHAIHAELRDAVLESRARLGLPSVARAAAAPAT
jgi:hypothetical protein